MNFGSIIHNTMQVLFERTNGSQGDALSRLGAQTGTIKLTKVGMHLFIVMLVSSICWVTDSI